MRISDWSSDVCSSDLAAAVAGAGMGGRRRKIGTARTAGRKDHGVRAEAVDSAVLHAERDHALALAILHDQVEREILDVEVGVRTEERRGGKGCVSECRYRCGPSD